MARNNDSDYRRLINTARWRRLRAEVLREHPMCEECERRGEWTEATEVHHKVPVEHGVTLLDKEALMYNIGNLMALCHNCHVNKHIEIGRSGKAAARRITSARLEEINARLYGEEPTPPGG